MAKLEITRGDLDFIRERDYFLTFKKETSSGGFEHEQLNAYIYWTFDGHFYTFYSINEPEFYDTHNDDDDDYWDHPSLLEPVKGERLISIVGNINRPNEAFRMFDVVMGVDPDDDEE